MDFLPPIRNCSRSKTVGLSRYNSLIGNHTPLLGSHTRLTAGYKNTHLEVVEAQRNSCIQYTRYKLYISMVEYNSRGLFRITQLKTLSYTTSTLFQSLFATTYYVCPVLHNNRPLVLANLRIIFQGRHNCFTNPCQYVCTDVVYDIILFRWALCTGW